MGIETDVCTLLILRIDNQLLRTDYSTGSSTAVHSDLNGKEIPREGI